MAKEQPLEFEGIVTDVMAGGRFTVKLEDNDHEILATLSGKMRTNNIKVIMSDKVKVEMTPYDLSRGRIVFRYK